MGLELGVLPKFVYFVHLSKFNYWPMCLQKNILPDTLSVYFAAGKKRGFVFLTWKLGDMISLGKPLLLARMYQNALTISLIVALPSSLPLVS